MSTEPRTRVLVADDSALTVTSLATLLELEGFEVATALNGRDALECARRFQPRIAVLDIGMPILSGHQVAQAIRSEPWGTDMLLIALTGWAREEDRSESLAAGFDRHLNKPLRVEDILACFGEHRSTAGST